MTSRPLAALLALLTSTAGPAVAGTVIGDIFPDTSYASGQIRPGWTRFYYGSMDERAVGFARTADGGSVVVLSVPGGAVGPQIGLFRLTADGQLAGTGFGTLGRRLVDAGFTSVTTMTLDAEGRILVAGTIPGMGGVSDFGIMRFNTDASTDATFGTAGRAIVGFDTSIAFADGPTSMLVQADGRIVIAGSSQPSGSLSEFAVIRLMTSGAIDTSFGTIDNGAGGRRGTRAPFFTGKAAYGAKILRAIGDNFVVVGTTVVSDLDTDFAARILSSNGLNIAGDVGSIALPIDEPGPGNSIYDNATSAALNDLRTITVVGTASGRAAARRIVFGPPSGSGSYTSLQIDTSFVGSAIPGRPYRYVSAYANTPAEDVVVRGDGKAFLVGRNVPSGADMLGLTMRLKRDGSPDTSYSTEGTYAYRAPTSSGANNYATEFKAVRLDGGKPLILGSAVDATAASTDYDGVVLRLNSDHIFGSAFQ
ncbi:hypothetical protein ACQQ2N_14095 [Dokdonella sp. MW10]|uniref:hypothetical protein n=1 Tax=Dokdonella sp. MW10 TaxID=2992926 RepID=UPI003F7EFA9B